MEAETRESELNLHPKGLREFLLTGGRAEGRPKWSIPLVDNSVFVLEVLLYVFGEAFNFAFLSNVVLCFETWIFFFF